MPPAIASDATSLYITHFHTSFVRCNGIAGSSIEQYQDVQPLLQEHPALKCAVIAVSALYIEKHHQSSANCAKSLALHYYRAGISFVQADLTRPNLRTNPSILWSTFFLGMFELMCDSSGEGWIKHFLHGTSALLQYRGPAAHVAGVGKRFFRVARVFEISRALIYSSESFLAQEEWRMLSTCIWFDEGAREWHPKEALFDLMLACSTLSMRAKRFVLSPQYFSDSEGEEILHETAQDGLSLRSALSAWLASVHQWSTGLRKSLEDAQMTIAMAYYHAISIYLSGVFDYHLHWTDRHILAPILSSTEIEAHVLALLEVVGQAMKSGSLAGILFFFPLRVAGARARTADQRREISRLLYAVSSRGYVVADAFIADLDDLWDKRPVR